MGLSVAQLSLNSCVRILLIQVNPVLGLKLCSTKVNLDCKLISFVKHDFEKKLKPSIDASGMNVSRIHALLIKGSCYEVFKVFCRLCQDVGNMCLHPRWMLHVYCTQCMKC